MSATTARPLRTPINGIPTATGVGDACDDCIARSSPDQREKDGDDFGNAFDPNITGDRIVNFADLAQLKRAFYTNDPIADLNADGVVNFADLAIMKKAFFKKPGPSGVVENNAP